MDFDYDNLGESLDQDEYNQEEFDLQSEDNLEEYEEQEDKELEDEDELNELRNYVEVTDNLADYLQTLEQRLILGKIDDYTFALENLLIKYTADGSFAKDDTI